MSSRTRQPDWKRPLIRRLAAALAEVSIERGWKTEEALTALGLQISPSKWSRLLNGGEALLSDSEIEQIARKLANNSTVQRLCVRLLGKNETLKIRDARWRVSIVQNADETFTVTEEHDVTVDVHSLLYAVVRSQHARTRARIACPELFGLTTLPTDADTFATTADEFMDKTHIHTLDLSETGLTEANRVKYELVSGSEKQLFLPDLAGDELEDVRLYSAITRHKGLQRVRTRSQEPHKPTYCDYRIGVIHTMESLEFRLEFEPLDERALRTMIVMPFLPDYVRIPDQSETGGKVGRRVATLYSNEQLVRGHGIAVTWQNQRYTGVRP